MPKEIERKYLVTDLSILNGRKGFAIVQGYLAKGAMTIRVRTIDDQAYVTLKGRSRGISRDEFEYPIPYADAVAMLETYCADHLVQKLRYLIPYGDHVFEVDVFEGRLSGLVVAEVELASEDEHIDLPPWVGKEVTHDCRFGNFDLAYAGTPPVALEIPARRLTCA